jgi:hypothetical protein
MKYIIVKTLLIILFSLLLACCSKGLSPEKKALAIVLRSNALGGNLSVEDVIKEMISEGGDNIRPLGWDVSRIEGQIYLVSYRYNMYSFEDGTGVRGYFFKVDIGNGSVSDVTNEYMMKMNPLSKPYMDEKEILDDFRENADTGLSG